MTQRIPQAHDYLCGWRAGFDAAASGIVTLADLETTSATADHTIAEDIAALHARSYAEDRMERNNLVWRVGVHIFYSFFDGFLDGARLRLMHQHARQAVDSAAKPPKQRARHRVSAPHEAA